MCRDKTMDLLPEREVSLRKKTLGRGENVFESDRTGGGQT